MPEFPKRSSPTYGEGEHKVTIHGAPCREKAYIRWSAAWFPKEIINKHSTFHGGLGRPEPY